MAKLGRPLAMTVAQRRKEIFLVSRETVWKLWV